MAIFDYSVLCRRLHWKEIRIVRDAWRCCSMSRTYRFHLILCVWRVLMKNQSDFTNLGYRVTGYTRFWRKGQLCRCNDGWWCWFCCCLRLMIMMVTLTYHSGAAKRLHIKTNYELRACISNITALLQGYLLKQKWNLFCCNLWFVNMASVIRFETFLLSSTSI